MPETTYYDYTTKELSSGPPPDYRTNDGSQTTGGLVLGQELSQGDEFVYGGKIYTYIGGADTGTNGAVEVGFFATTGTGASLKTHFFSQTADTNNNAYYLDPNQGFTVTAAPCFARTTRLATPSGEIAVESLNVGDLVTTMINGETVVRPVKWIGHRRVDITSHPRPETVEPVRIQRGAFADNVPHRDLLVSPDHAIFVDGKLVCARQLINGSTIRPDKTLAAVEYFHIELEAHSILLAEGLPAESYLNTGNSGFFINSDQPLTLHPDLTTETDYPARETSSCAPFIWADDDVRPIWQRLAERAAVLGQPVTPIDVDTDPDLHVVTQGRTLRPFHAGDGLYQFMLPPDATEVRVISRAAAPTDVRPWTEDRRLLGVYAERIVMRAANDVVEVPIDHPGLSQGWWQVERAGPALRRWTDGNAVLQLPASDGPVLLEIRASSSGMQYPARAAV